MRRSCYQQRTAGLGFAEDFAGAHVSTNLLANSGENIVYKRQVSWIVYWAKIAS